MCHRSSGYLRAARHAGRGGPSADPRAASLEVSYPCVLKPTFLAASRGVIRANDAAALIAAARRVVAILRAPDVKPCPDPDSRRLLVESFVPGGEVALEGMLVQGRLRVLANWGTRASTIRRIGMRRSAPERSISG